MKKVFIVCSLVTALIGVMAFNAVAIPIPINGAISFSGTSVQNNPDLSVATAFASFSDVVISATGGTGDYAPVLSGQSVTANPFTFFPSLVPNPLVPQWTFTFGGNTYSFDATGLTIDSRNSNTITMHGPGIAHITGFADTPSNWYFSANRADTTSSFSASANVKAVPEPASMLLLGTGLVGIGGFARRKSKK